MSNRAHLIDQEELMAYLDGELPVGRAAIVASHLEGCAECKALTADLRQVSQHMAAWQVGASSSLARSIEDRPGLDSYEA